MKKLLIYYNFIFVSLMILAGFIGATNVNELTSAILFYPLSVYFLLLVFPKRNKALVPKREELERFKKKKKIKPKAKEKVLKAEKVEDDIVQKRLDRNRRAFIKLIGSAGVTVFLFSIFTKRAQAAFFGSVPGPGTVALKDTSGTQIDPAEKLPTDGYKINQIDDSSPAYYGFVNKDGAWFIMKEDPTTGDYRYTKGSSDFTNATTGWPNRANLTYDYFDVVF